MAQHDYIISNATFPAVRTDINNALSAIQTTNSGTSRPTGAVAGQLWLDTTSATTPTLKYYDGADDISLATIDHSANTVNWLDSTVSITGLSTTATGTVLTLSDSVNTTTVNLIIDNQKEIRFRETTANGTNYVALKAPASLSADLTFTLPATDGTNGQVLQTNGSGALSFVTVTADGTADWDTSVKTTGFTATANKGYFCNTTSAGFTVTLPATPSAGDEVILLDYAGTFDTNALIISPNGNKIEGTTTNQKLSADREGARLVYIDSTQGWLAYSGINEGTDALEPAVYTADFLVVAGGGAGRGSRGGGGGAGGYRNSYSTETSGGGGASEASLSLGVGVSYTITVGAGGTGTTGTSGTSGVDSSISGSNITTITSSGGGYGNSTTGGSGGGGAGSAGNNGGSGTANQGRAGGNGADYSGGGGGGADTAGSNGGYAVGGAGGNGLSSSITASSVARGGGGGGCAYAGTVNGGAGGTGGGGAGRGTSGVAGISGTANTGGGGGGSETGAGGSGGSGVVILRMPTANYTGTTTGSPTVTTSGADTILVYNSSGTYTG
jgi:mucin-19